MIYEIIATSWIAIASLIGMTMVIVVFAVCYGKDEDGLSREQLVNDVLKRAEEIDRANLKK